MSLKEIIGNKLGMIKMQLMSSYNDGAERGKALKESHKKKVSKLVTKNEKNK